MWGQFGMRASPYALPSEKVFGTPLSTIKVYTNFCHRTPFSLKNGNAPKIICCGRYFGRYRFYYASIRSLLLSESFRYVFSISVALSLSMLHVKHYPQEEVKRGW